MTYEYRCAPCAHSFDVMKSHTEMSRAEACPKCEREAIRQFVPQRVFLSGTKVQHAEYNPGLGCVVRNKEHRAELAKAKGLVEIGNDYKNTDNIHKEFEQKREQRSKDSYDKIEKEIKL